MSTRKEAASRGKKKMYHHPDLRAQLVESAVAFLKKNRVEDLSLRGLAREIGVSHMAPYRHFSTKEDLLAAVIEQGFLRLTAMFDEVLNQKDQTFKSVFTNLGKAYIQFVVKYPDHARLMFNGMMCDPGKHPQAHIAGQEAFGRLLRMLQRGTEEGYLSKKDNPYLQGHMIWSTVHGAAMLLIEDQFHMIDGAPEFEIDSFVDFVAERLLRGMK